MKNTRELFWRLSSMYTIKKMKINIDNNVAVHALSNSFLVGNLMKPSEIQLKKLTVNFVSNPKNWIFDAKILFPSQDDFSLVYISLCFSELWKKTMQLPCAFNSCKSVRVCMHNTEKVVFYIISGLSDDVTWKMK